MQEANPHQDSGGKKKQPSTGSEKRAGFFFYLTFLVIFNIFIFDICEKSMEILKKNCLVNFFPLGSGSNWSLIRTNVDPDLLSYASESETLTLELMLHQI